MPSVFCTTGTSKVTLSYPRKSGNYQTVEQPGLRGHMLYFLFFPVKFVLYPFKYINIYGDILSFSKTSTYYRIFKKLSITILRGFLLNFFHFPVQRGLPDTRNPPGTPAPIIFLALSDTPHKEAFLTLSETRNIPGTGNITAMIIYEF